MTNCNLCTTLCMHAVYNEWMYVCSVLFSFGVWFSLRQGSSILLMHTVHAPSIVSPVSNGYVWNVASLIREILLRSSFFFPSTPTTLDTFLSSNENSDWTKLTAKFRLEQLRALMLARKLGVKCRSCEGTDADNSLWCRHFRLERVHELVALWMLSY